MKSTLLTFFIALLSYSSFSQQVYTSREVAITWLELRIGEILPWNWNLVKTDSSITVYFCRTAWGKDRSQRNPNLLVQDSTLYGSEFYHQPVPDSVVAIASPKLARCHYPQLDTTGLSNQPVNNILRITLTLDTVGPPNNLSQKYPYYVNILPSVACGQQLYYKEALTPFSPYYTYEFGKELRREFWNLHKHIFHLMGYDTIDSLKGE